MIRVTVGSASYGALAGLQASQSRLAALQAQLSSGKQITTPSDDPSGTVRALQLRADLKRNTAYTDSATDAIGWMSASDTAYSQIVKLAQNARTLVVQASNTGASTGTSADAIAAQIDALRTSLLSQANSSYNGRPIFGGTTGGTQAYDPSTGKYIGDNGTVNRTVGPQAQVQINQNGPAVFGDDTTGNDLFSLLANISSSLKTTGAPPSGALAQLDTAIQRISGQQAVEGAAYQRVQIAQAVQTSTNLALTTQLSDIQDIDIAKVAVQVSTAQVNYQAALQTTASIRQMSLLNFLN
jgi:flagellar hook-associated protein 3 FlgL